MTRKPAAVRGEEEEGEDEGEEGGYGAAVDAPVRRRRCCCCCSGRREKKDAVCVITNRVKGSSMCKRPLVQGDGGPEVLGGLGGLGRCS